MKFKAFLNRDGGTLRTMDIDAYAARVKAAFEAKGHEIDVAVVEAAEMERALRHAATEVELDGLIAGGGDGTISTAAGIAWKSGLALGVIPAGTMNLFARSLGLPLDVDAVLPVLAQGFVRPVDIATANGRPFVHQFSAGLHARMVALRNRMDYASRLGKIRASIRAAFGVILNPPAFEVEFRAAGSHGKRRVSAISVSNNAFGTNPLMVPDDVSGGHLGFYLADALAPSGVARLAVDILRGRLKDNEAVNFFEARDVRLHFPRMAKLGHGLLDGELIPLARDVDLKIHAGELKVLVPSDAG